MQRRKLTLQIPSFQSDEVVLPEFVKRRTPFDEYEIIEKVGEGAFGSVFQAKSKDGKIKAIKVLAGPHDSRCISKILNEAKIGMEIQHPNIVSIDEVFFDGTSFFLVMDLISPISNPTDSIKDRLIMVKQLVSAVTHLYSHGILHRDIKVENTGLRQGTDGQQLCLFDFGESCRISDQTYECVGTTFNLSPEVVKDCQYSDRSEVWDILCYLIEVLTGKSMITYFFEKSTTEITQYDVYFKLNIIKEAPIPAVFKTDRSTYGRQLLHILEKGLAINPKERLTLLELDHLLRDLIDLL